jgi:hypothetical protein
VSSGRGRRDRDGERETEGEKEGERGRQGANGRREGALVLRIMHHFSPILPSYLPSAQCVRSPGYACEKEEMAGGATSKDRRHSRNFVTPCLCLGLGEEEGGGGRGKGGGRILVLLNKNISC